MSKITQALEKAARERLKAMEDKPTVSPKAIAVSMPLFQAAPQLNETAEVVGQVNIDAHIVSLSDSKSPIAEQYRMLKANFQSERARKHIKTIVVTSSLNGEGKSVTSLNLALTLARDEQLKVVLVDADLRKSSINKWLGVAQSKTGLSTALRNGGTLNDALIKLQSPALTILPAGPTPHDAAALLESGAMRRVLAALKTQFDVVIIDAPPVLAVADPCILASQSDSTVFVVRAGRTQRRAILQAQNRLQQMKAEILGCVLTHAEDVPGYSKYYRYYQEEKARNGGTSGLSVSTN